MINRKDRIVQAALKCFVSQGIAQTRMSDVAEKAGVDQPLIRYYFPTLDSLYVEVIALALESLKEMSVQAIVKNADHPERILTQYIRAPFEWGLAYPGYRAIWVYFYHLATFNPIFSSMNKTIRDNGRERISVLLYQGVEKEVFEIPKGWSVAELALTIQGLMTGNTTMAFTEGAVDIHRFADATCKAILALVAKNKRGTG